MTNTEKSTTPVLSDEGVELFFRQVVDTYINPELEKRNAANLLPENYSLNSFQVIINVKKPIEIRLNNEIRAVITGRLGRAIDKGEQVRIDELKEIGEIIRVAEDSNAAHITGILLPNGSWHLVFDFQYNTAIRKQRLQTAEEFFEAASNALEKKHYRAFHESLFSSMEAAIMATLFALPVESYMNSKTHGLWHKQINQWSNQGNINPEFAQLFNKLSNTRSKARYSHEDFIIVDDEAIKMLETAKDYIIHLNDVMPKIYTP